MTLTELDVYTRQLSGIFATDTVTSTIMARFINEAYFELFRQNGWSWTATTLTSGDSPSFIAEFHAILAYRAAVKVLRFSADDTNKADAYTQEYKALQDMMERYYLSGGATGAVGTTTQMVAMVRSVTGIFDTKLIPDALVIVYVNNAFQELQMMRNWSWMRQSVTLPVGAVLDDVHTINTELDRDTVARISHVHLVNTAGDYTQIVLNTAHIENIHLNTGQAFYEIVDTPSEDVVPVPLISIKLAPEQTTTDSLVVEFTSITDISTGSDTTPIGPYNMLMVYRAAIRVLAQLRPDDKRVQSFAEEYRVLLDALTVQYALSNDDRSFQMGANETWLS